MGLLVNGAWQEDISRTKTAILSADHALRNFVTADGSPARPAKAACRRSRPLSSLRIACCPGASHDHFPQSEEARKRHLVSVTSRSWQDRLGIRHRTGGTRDEINDKATLAEVYLVAIRLYRPRVGSGAVGQEATHHRQQRILRNHPMLNSAFDAFTNARTDFYPPELHAEIDRINDLVYPKSTRRLSRRLCHQPSGLRRSRPRDFRHIRSARRAPIAAALSSRPSNHRSGLALFPR